MESPRVVGYTYPSDLLSQNQVLMLQYPLVLRKDVRESEVGKQKGCWAL